MINNNQAGTINLAVLKSMGAFGKTAGRNDQRQTDAMLARIEKESNVIAALLVSVVKKLAAVDMMLQVQSKMYQYEYNQQQSASRELAIENVAPDASPVDSTGPNGIELIQRTGILGNVLKLAAIAGISSIMSAYESVTKSLGGMFDLLGSAASDINQNAAGGPPTTPTERAKERMQQREVLRPIQQTRPSTPQKEREAREVSPRIEGAPIASSSVAGVPGLASEAAASQVQQPKLNPNSILQPEVEPQPPSTPPSPSPPSPSPPATPVRPSEPDLTPPKNISDKTREPVAGAASGINSGYGMRDHPVYKRRAMHQGVDIAKPPRTPVYAFADGYVFDLRFQNDRKGGGYSGYGKCIRLRHENLGVDSFYAHLDNIAPGVVKGKRVNKGDLIGYVGKTGATTGYHLHFEIRTYDDKQINPVPWLRGSKQEQAAAGPPTKDIQMAALEKQRRTVRSRTATSPNVQLAAATSPSKGSSPQQRSAVLSAKSVLDDYRDAFGLGDKHNESKSPQQDVMLGFA